MFDLITESRDGERSTLKYDPKLNQLTNEDGSDVFPQTVNLKYKDFPVISPENPGTKGVIKTLKIQLGLKCNYSCQYCVQSSHIDSATNTNNDDATTFLDNLDKWIQVPPNKIELWGGEPFVYWSKLKILVPALRAKFPEATFIMHTNGSLLDDEKIDFIEAYDINICLSHDGPNQKYRGPDPLNDPKKAAAIHNLFRRRGPKMSFNIVLHSKNYDLDAIANWFEERLPGANLSIEGIVNVYDSYSLNNLGRFSKNDLLSLASNVMFGIVNHPYRYKCLVAKMISFIQALKNRRPLVSLGQKCGMDRDDTISVDLEGNVTTCQNVGAEGKHNIGNVDDYENIALNTSHHFSTREECMNCPVVQLCRGSCMFLEDDFFAQSCWNEYYFNLGILGAAIYSTTGNLLIGINGKILRPEFSEDHMKKFPSLKELYQ